MTTSQILTRARFDARLHAVRQYMCAGWSAAEIGARLGVDKRTVVRYRAWWRIRGGT